jgi:hypothetical protein
MRKPDKPISPADVPEVFGPWSSRAFGKFVAAFVLGGFVFTILAAVVVESSRDLGPAFTLLLGLVGMHTLVSLYLLHLMLKAQAVLISQLSKLTAMSEVNQELMIIHAERREGEKRQDKHE